MREIILAEDFVHCRLDPQQDKLATKRIKTIAALSDPLKDEDVKPFDGEPNVFIYKPNARLRAICDAEFRVVFRVTDTTLELIVADQRDSVYRKANNRPVCKK